MQLCKAIKRYQHCLALTLLILLLSNTVIITVLQASSPCEDHIAHENGHCVDGDIVKQSGDPAMIWEDSVAGLPQHDNVEINGQKITGRFNEWGDWGYFEPANTPRNNVIILPPGKTVVINKYRKNNAMRYKISHSDTASSNGMPIIVTQSRKEFDASIDALESNPDVEICSINNDLSCLDEASPVIPNLSEEDWQALREYLESIGYSLGDTNIYSGCVFGPFGC